MCVLREKKKDDICFCWYSRSLFTGLKPIPSESIIPRCL